jgi:hypothetical protein
MQGLQALDQFKNFVSKIGGLGRYEDTYIVHAAEGETVVPMEVLDQNPVLKKRLFKTMMEMGIEPGRYIVGNELNSKNPVTGQPEFFLKRIKKALADISGYAAPIIGAMYGAPAGALAGGVLGSFKRENPGDPNQALQMALLGGGSGVASNLLGGAKGMDLLTGRGFSGAIPTGEGRSPMDIYKYFTEKDAGMDRFRDYVKIFDPASAVIESGGSNEALQRTVAGILRTDPTLKDKESRDILRRVLGLESEKTGLSVSQLASIYGLGTLGLGAIIDATSDEQDVGLPADTMPKGNVIENILNPTAVFPGAQARADGGIMDLQDGGESKGPGTGTSDSIPAMLSDGEFVMTAKAVRGAGGGDRREGAKKMYEAMDRLEASA